MQNQLSINLNVFSHKSLTDQIAHGIERLIAEGLLSKGEKLPSIRELARHFRVSIGTVRSALKLLTNNGFIESRHGAGFFVSHTSSSSEVSKSNRVRTRETKFHEIKKQMNGLDNPTSPLGIPLLRRHLKTWLRHQFRLDVDPDQIAIFPNESKAKNTVSYLNKLRHSQVPFSVESLQMLTGSSGHSQESDNSLVFYIIPSEQICFEPVALLVLPKSLAKLTELTIQATGAQTPLAQQLLLLAHFRGHRQLPASGSSAGAQQTISFLPV